MPEEKVSQRHVHKAKYDAISGKLLDDCAECGNSFRDTDVHCTSAEWRAIPAAAQEVLADPKATPAQLKAAFSQEITSAKPPAADAGPRCTCSHNYADHSAVRNHYCMMAGCPCERYELLANPPVPQEAAPRLCTNCREESWTHCRFHEPAHCHVECAQGTVPPWPTEQYPPRCKRVDPATAPDSAMRVAREFEEYYKSQQPKWRIGDVHLDKLAALIREAGSERERKLEEKLQWAVNWISHGRGRTRCIICDHLVGGHSPGCEVAEASRLLGGEANG